MIWRRRSLAWLRPFHGVWAIRPGMARLMIEEINGVRDLRWSLEDFRAAQAMAEEDLAPNETGYPPFVELLPSGLAVVAIEGVLSKHRLLSGPPTLGDIAGAIRQAGADGDVPLVVARFDTPGGSIPDLDATADAIRQVAEIKPVIAYVHDCCCSAGYWLASQCTQIVTNPTADVGAIGVYAVLIDASARARRQGFDIHVVKTGEMKGRGILGTRLSDDQLADKQREIDAVGELFVEAVASGRGISIEQARELRDGRVHVGRQALDLGLVDRVARYDELLVELGADSASVTVSNPTEDPMTQPSNPPPTATSGGTQPTAQSTASQSTAPTAPTVAPVAVAPRSSTIGMISPSPQATSPQPTLTPEPQASEPGFRQRVLSALGFGQSQANAEPSDDELRTAIDAAQARLDRGQSEQRLASLERQLSTLEVDQALAALGDRYTPAMQKAGARELLVELHAQGTGEGSAYQRYLATLQATPDPQLTGGPLASSTITGEPPMATELSADERQVLARNGIDDARAQEILARFPNALRG